MDIIDKLKYYSDSAQPKPETQKKTNLQELAEKLGGYVFEDNSLPLIKRKTEFSFNKLQLGDFLTNSIKLPVLTKGDFSKPINIKDLLFFDLETTGLSGGAGTYPFLIGIAFFEDNGFKVIQYFLPEYDRDIHAYLDFKKYIKSKSILVSYNGKSYDYPLLKNRFILNRYDNIFKEFYHIDLLHLSRRIWKNSLKNCSLGNIEQQIFKFSRLNDIEGYLIPHAYFDYLQSGNYDNIINIISHNEQDLISLGRLIVHLSQIENEEENSKLSDSELNSLFETAIKSSSLEKAKYYYKFIKKRESKVPHKAIFNFSLLLKRNSDWKNAIKIWESLSQNENYALFALEELAKYHEHREKDINKAMKFTDRAFELINIICELKDDNCGKMKKRDFEHRKERLNKKLTRE
jgi:uncharacterized protein YprB with RNaseH-like and TPR domain